MLLPDCDLSVEYYKIAEDTPLYKATMGYRKKCQKFLENVTEFLNRYNAHNAVLSNVKSLEVRNIDFEEQNIPEKGWEESGFGSFKPKRWTIASIKLNSQKFKLPTFYQYYEEARPLLLVTNVRYGQLGNTMVLALSAKVDNSALAEKFHLEPLKKSEFEQLKTEATEDQRKHAERMHRLRYFDSFEIYYNGSKAFHSNDKINQEKQKRWERNFIKN